MDWCKHIAPVRASQMVGHVYRGTLRIPDKLLASTLLIPSPPYMSCIH